jgi:hypothetical protein
MEVHPEHGINRRAHLQSLSRSTVANRRTIVCEDSGFLLALNITVDTRCNAANAVKTGFSRTVTWHLRNTKRARDARLLNSPTPWDRNTPNENMDACVSSDNMRAHVIQHAINVCAMRVDCNACTNVRAHLSLSNLNNGYDGVVEIFRNVAN